MSWLKRKLDVLGHRKDAERRMPRQASLSQVEQLEARLCLGSLNSPDMGNWTPEDPNEAILDSSQVAMDLSIEETTQIEPDPGTDSSENHSQTESAPDAYHLSGSEDYTTNITMGLGLDANQTQVDWNAEEPRAEESTTLPASATGETETEDNPESMGVVQNTVEGSSGEGVNDGQTETATTGSLTNQTYAQANAQGHGGSENVYLPPWWNSLEEPVTIRYDFRNVGEYQNQITDEQKALAITALDNWTRATGGKLQFVQDTEAADHEIMNIGTGDLAAYGYTSGAEGKLGVGGGAVSRDAEGDIIVSGVAWLDSSENWDHAIGNGNPDGTVDFFTAVGHETGHALGFNDSAVFTTGQDIMLGFYEGERGASSFDYAVQSGTMHTGIISQAPEDAEYDVHALQMMQLTPAEVTLLLNRASAATVSDDAVIAIVDRGGTILGVHVEAGVIQNIDDPTNTAIAAGYGAAGNGNGIIDTDAERRALAFFAEGAVAKARTAAFFSNGDPTNVDETSPVGTRAPLTSRLVRFISQTTITQREVEAISALNAPDTLRGPGYVAPIGLGGHFPPEVRHTPPVDLFAIEHTNRDRVPGDAVALVADPTLVNDFVNPGIVAPFVPMVNVRTVGGRPVNANQNPEDPPAAGDILRFNIPFENIDPTKVDALREPLSFGEVSGLDPNARSRGIATLPGGIPIFRDCVAGPGGLDAGIGDTLIGGIGVFFPGRDGFATFEQGYKPGISQAEFERTNAPKVLEAEFMALVAIGGSLGAARQGIPLAKTDPFAGTALAALPDIDLPFGRLDLVGITLQVVGPIAGRQGVGEVILRGLAIGSNGQPSGGQIYAPTDAAGNRVGGRAVPFGYIVPPRDGIGITAGQVNQIITNAFNGAGLVRAAIRLPISSRTRMVLAVTDLAGNVVGLFRMQDATIFSIDVAVAKARNVAYYANAAELNPLDQLPTVPAGTAFTNRTFRFLAEPRFPSGVDGDPAGPWSTLNNPFIDPFTAANLGTPAPDTAYLDTVLGRNSFNPTSPINGDGLVVPGGANRNFLDPNNINNQNGIVFFPGSTPLYVNGVLVGGFGVSGDGVDQDDVVTFIGAQGFLPNQNGVLRSDQTSFRDVRLPYQKFLRNPFG